MDIQQQTPSSFWSMSFGSDDDFGCNVGMDDLILNSPAPVASCFDLDQFTYLPDSEDQQLTSSSPSSISYDMSVPSSGHDSIHSSCTSPLPLTDATLSMNNAGIALDTYHSAKQPASSIAVTSNPLDMQFINPNALIVNPSMDAMMNDAPGMHSSYPFMESSSLMMPSAASVPSSSMVMDKDYYISSMPNSHANTQAQYSFDPLHWNQLNNSMPAFHPGMMIQQQQQLQQQLQQQQLQQAQINFPFDQELRNLYQQQQHLMMMKLNLARMAAAAGYTINPGSLDLPKPAANPSIPMACNYPVHHLTPFQTAMKLNTVSNATAATTNQSLSQTGVVTSVPLVPAVPSRSAAMLPATAALQSVASTVTAPATITSSIASNANASPTAATTPPLASASTRTPKTFTSTSPLSSPVPSASASFEAGSTKKEEQACVRSLSLSTPCAGSSASVSASHLSNSCAVGETLKRKRTDSESSQETPSKKKKTSKLLSKRKRKSPRQLTILETEFVRNPMPNKELREQLGVTLGLTSRQVQIWFQNKRAKVKHGDSTSNNPAAASATATDASPANSIAGVVSAAIASMKTEPSLNTVQAESITPSIPHDANLTTASSIATPTKMKSDCKVASGGDEPLLSSPSSTACSPTPLK